MHNQHARLIVILYQPSLHQFYQLTKAKPEAQTISPNDENGTTTKHSPQPPSMFILVQSSENTDNIMPNDENGTTTKHSPQPPSMFILVQSSENTGNIMHSLCTIDDKEGT